jgi:hypothetical protein
MIRRVFGQLLGRLRRRVRWPCYLCSQEDESAAFRSLADRLRAAVIEHAKLLDG